MHLKSTPEEFITSIALLVSTLTMTYNDFDFNDINPEKLFVGSIITSHSGEKEKVAAIDFISSSSGKLWTVTMVSGKVISIALYYKHPLDFTPLW